MAGPVEYRLKLYVTGGTRSSEQAIAALRRLCQSTTERIHTEVVDVLLHPEMMLDLDAVPVLVREWPTPVRLIRGIALTPAEIDGLLREV
jgi:hypothetical protein